MIEKKGRQRCLPFYCVKKPVNKKHTYFYFIEIYRERGEDIHA